MVKERIDMNVCPNRIPSQIHAYTHMDRHTKLDLLLKVEIVMSQVLFIGNCLRWKSFVVAELNFNLLENFRG